MAVVRSDRRRLAFRLGVSLALVFHLTAVGIAPNKENYLGSKLAPLVEPYIGFLELSSPWNFFAPEPGPPPVFIEWELLGEGATTLGMGRWPDFPDPFWLRERQNRRIALARFMVYSEVRAEALMVPWLCKSRPDVRSVRLWRVMHQLPNLYDVASGKTGIGLSKDAEKRYISHSFCDLAGGGRSS